MFKLVQNELMKMFKRPGTYVMIGLLLLMISVAGGVLKYQENTATEADNQNWKQGLQIEIDETKKELKDMGDAPKNVTAYLERDIALKEYRLDHNILTK